MSFDNIPVIIQPRNIKINLFQHQLALVHRMEQIENNKQVEIETNELFDFRTYNYCETKVGINSEMSGFGKTLSMITLISRDKMKWNNSSEYILTNIKEYSGGLIKNIKTKTYEKLQTTLVVVSSSVLNQWVEEFKLSDLSCVVINNSKKVRNIDIENYDVVIVIPNFYNMLIEKYYGYAWKRFIFDEPGHIKIPSMKPIIAGFYWLVTATPKLIYSLHCNSRKSFMYSLLDKGQHPNIEYHFRNIIIKNPNEFVLQSFEMPKTTHHYYECLQPLYKTIQGLTSPTILSMISGGNIKGAIELLGGNKTDNIVELVRRKKLEEIEEITARINIYNIRNNQEQKQIWENKKLHVENQIEELENRFKNILSGNCNICFSNIVNPVMEPYCQNIFCGECLLTWLNTKHNCPLCRNNIISSELVYIETSESKIDDESKNNNTQKTKNQTVIDIINNNIQGKFIIFSSWDQTWLPIISILKENNISFDEIKGSANSRNKKIENFKNGNISCLFLNSRWNGAGINLQEATDIILYHEMSEDIIKQILGRALRLGRKLPLQVHNLV